MSGIAFPRMNLCKIGFSVKNLDIYFQVVKSTFCLGVNSFHGPQIFYGKNKYHAFVSCFRVAVIFHHLWIVVSSCRKHSDTSEPFFKASRFYTVCYDNRTYVISGSSKYLSTPFSCFLCCRHIFRKDYICLHLIYSKRRNHVWQRRQVSEICNISIF